jgi:hypothetical protein
VDYLPPEPLAGWIEKMMMKATEKMRARKQDAEKHG